MGALDSLAEVRNTCPAAVADRSTVVVARSLDYKGLEVHTAVACRAVDRAADNSQGSESGPLLAGDGKDQHRGVLVAGNSVAAKPATGPAEGYYLILIAWRGSEKDGRASGTC